ncbi:MAG TPA: tRNA pseudouridine(38-40) synthase TruA [Kofleriaceae bacterium]|nr:tRNA pseudouridine(38-40) synthase TruA [Kofleriaceae bacterium]
MRHIRLTIEYDGTGLGGWQRQHNAPTVQGHLEAALATMLQQETRVTGASRTDAGVHARGQVALFHTEKPIPLYGIRRGLNTLLPEQIAITDATEVSEDFHPRFSATGKHYRYLVLARQDRAPRFTHRAWHRPYGLDEAAMRVAAAALIGEHDFTSFRAAGCSAKTTTRRIDELAIGRPASEPDVIAFDVRGNAFLRHMVRILVGTLVDIGEGRTQPTQMPEILRARQREAAGQTAPAHGLELLAVHYDGRRGAL